MTLFFFYSDDLAVWMLGAVGAFRPIIDTTFALDTKGGFLSIHKAPGKPSPTQTFKVDIRRKTVEVGFFS